MGRSCLKYAQDSDEDPRSSANTDVIMPGTAKYPELNKMMKRFAALMGNVETFDLVTAASQWMTSIQIHRR